MQINKQDSLQLKELQRIQVEVAKKTAAFLM